jgi:hypothetical protein
MLNFCGPLPTDPPNFIRLHFILLTTTTIHSIRPILSVPNRLPITIKLNESLYDYNDQAVLPGNALPHYG